MVACGFQLPASDLEVRAVGAVGKSGREIAFNAFDKWLFYIDALPLCPSIATRVQKASAACNGNCEMAY